MQTNQSRWLRLLAVLLAFVLVAAACGDDDETGAESSDDTASDAADDDSGSAADNGDASAEDTADEEPAVAPLKIGMIAQTEELLAFPGVPAAAEAVVGYANAEDGGNIELVICSAGAVAIRNREVRICDAGITSQGRGAAVGQITVSRNCQLASTTCRITNL